MDAPTRYRFELVCPDLGEYDGLFIAAVLKAIAELAGESGLVDLDLSARRFRRGEF